MADEDSLFNVFVSKRVEKESSSDKILFEIEGLKTTADNETYSASSELENLQGNGLSNVRISKGQFDTTDYEDRSGGGKVQK